MKYFSVGSRNAPFLLQLDTSLLPNLSSPQTSFSWRKVTTVGPMPAQQHFSDLEDCLVFHASFWQMQPKTQGTEVVSLPISMLGSSMAVACSHQWHLTLSGWDTLKEGGGISAGRGWVEVPPGLQ